VISRIGGSNLALRGGSRSALALLRARKHYYRGVAPCNMGV